LAFHAFRIDGDVGQFRLRHLHDDRRRIIPLGIDFDTHGDRGGADPYDVGVKTDDIADETGCLNMKELTDTVATRPRARRMAGMAPATSTWAMTQPPNTSPFWLRSAGIGTTRKVECFSGSVRRVGCMFRPSPKDAAIFP